MIKQLSLLLLLSAILISCKQSSEDISALPTYDANGDLTAVIEIPAGTNKKIEFDKSNLDFVVDKIDGKERVINYLPYVGNYGFIPSTLSDLDKGGDGDPLDIIVFAESLPTGTVLPVVPIGILKIIDEGEEDDKIIAVPKDKSLRIMDVETYKDWSKQYGSTKMILLTWYRSYDTSGQNIILGFRNENTAKVIIEKWQIGTANNSK